MLGFFSNLKRKKVEGNESIQLLSDAQTKTTARPRKGRGTEAHSGGLFEYHRLAWDVPLPLWAPNPHPALLNHCSACWLGRHLPDPQEQWAGEGAGVATKATEEGAGANPRQDRERNCQRQLCRDWPQFPRFGSPQSTALFFPFLFFS